MSDNDNTTIETPIADVEVKSKKKFFRKPNFRLPRKGTVLAVGGAFAAGAGTVLAMQKTTGRTVDLDVSLETPAIDYTPESPVEDVAHDS